MSETQDTRARTDDRTPLALAAGLVAALAGGVAWAAIVLLTDYEIGWVAWGIGALVGWAMARVTVNRSRSLALTAAALALMGLVAGKGLVTVGSQGAIADELTANQEFLASAVAWQMYHAGELEPGTMAAIQATEQAGDTLSDALWADMTAQAANRVATLPEADRRALAEQAAAGFISQLGIVDGVRAQLSGFDLLWLFLALGTAFQMMDARKGEPEPVAGETDPGTGEEPSA